MTQLTNFHTPWTLAFERDGTEDVAIVFDAEGDEIVRSRGFWLPEGDDPLPPTLAAVRLIKAAPELLAAAERAEFLMRRVSQGDHRALENLPSAATQARKAIAKSKGGRS
jgi:hypothetical protein